MRTLWAMLGKQRRRFLVIVVATAVQSTIEPVLHTLMLKWLFDEAVIAQNFLRFLYLSLAYLALGLIVVGLSYASSLWRKAFVNRATLDVEQRLVERTLHLDWRAFSREGSGSFVSRIHKDTLEGFLPALGFVFTAVQQGVAGVVFLVVLLYLSWQAALTLLLLVPPLLWVARRLGKRVRETTSEEREGEARLVQVLADSLKAFRFLRIAFPLRLATLDAYRRALDSYLDSTYRNHRFLVLQQTWSDVFMNLANTLSLVVGGYYVLVRELTFGGYLAFINAFWRAVNELFSLLRRMSEFQRYAQILKRMEEILSLVPAPYARPSPIVTLRDIRLSYDDKIVLAMPGVLEITPGERVLLLGPNGVGKTSLLHVLSGYLAPDHGEVTLPPRVTSLTAPIELPPLTVKELIGDPSCLAALGLEVLADHTPDALSSGQKQKAAIGALLSQQADLYIFDEPLANLDDQSKDTVMELIFERTMAKALVVVLHGEDALRDRFDTIITLVAGEQAIVRRTAAWETPPESGLLQRDLPQQGPLEPQATD